MCVCAWEWERECVYIYMYGRVRVRTYKCEVHVCVFMRLEGTEKRETEKKRERDVCECAFVCVCVWERERERERERELERDDKYDIIHACAYVITIWTALKYKLKSFVFILLYYVLIFNIYYILRWLIDWLRFYHSFVLCSILLLIFSKYVIHLTIVVSFELFYTSTSFCLLASIYLCIIWQNISVIYYCIALQCSALQYVNFILLLLCFLFLLFSLFLLFLLFFRHNFAVRLSIRSSVPIIYTENRFKKCKISN